MEKYNRKAVSDDLSKYDYLAKKDDFIEVCEWNNGEGIDVTINEYHIHLTYGQLEAINYLSNSLNYDK